MGPGLVPDLTMTWRSCCSGPTSRPDRSERSYQARSPGEHPVLAKFFEAFPPAVCRYYLVRFDKAQFERFWRDWLTRPAPTPLHNEDRECVWTSPSEDLPSPLTGQQSENIKLWGTRQR